MKKILFGILLILIALNFSGCQDDVEYYDYAGLGVSVNAWNLLSTNGFSTGVVYSGYWANQLFTIVVNNPASDSADTLYRKRTYAQTKNWLNKYGLPLSILTYAKNSLTAYYYVDISYNIWAVFVEDVSSNYKSVLPGYILERNIIEKDGYVQEEIKIE